MSVAVLLDNFITASAHMELVEREKETARILRDNQSRSPLEPLLVKVRACAREWRHQRRGERHVRVRMRE